MARWGGLPALHAEPLSFADRMAALLDRRRDWLERVLPRAMRTRDAEAFGRVRRAAALGATGILSHAEIGRATDQSPTSARRHVRILRDAFHVFLLEPVKRDLTSDAVRTPKLYWTDTGWLRADLDLWGSPTPRLFENTVVAEVVKWIRTADRPVVPRFYRTRSGLDVTLLLRTPAGYLGIDVCPRERVDGPDARPLKLVGAALGRRWRGGLVVFDGAVRDGRTVHDVELLDEAAGVWAVPAWRLFAPLPRRPGGAALPGGGVGDAPG